MSLTKSEPDHYLLEELPEEPREPPPELNEPPELEPELIEPLEPELKLELEPELRLELLELLAELERVTVLRLVFALDDELRVELELPLLTLRLDELLPDTLRDTLELPLETLRDELLELLLELVLLGRLYVEPD